MFSFFKKIIFILIVIILIAIGYLLYSGYEMYQKAIKEISIENKINSIKSKSNYTELCDISRNIY